MTLRIGAVSYLNTKPLIYGLQDCLPASELSLDLPSRLADQLNGGNLDIALIPSVEFLRSQQMRIVSNACIACRGPVRSVRMLFRCPPREVRSLALDEGSRTSSVLAQLLLTERFGISLQLQPLQIHADFRQSQTDAVLIIGDRAMHVDATGFVENWDLGQEWTHETGLPFVFAIWAASIDAKLPQADLALQRARDDGLTNIKLISEQEAVHHGLSTTDCHHYFTQQLHFHLGERELQGLELFRRKASELSLIPMFGDQLALQPL